MKPDTSPFEAIPDLFASLQIPNNPLERLCRHPWLKELKVAEHASHYLFTPVPYDFLEEDERQYQKVVVYFYRYGSKAVFWNTPEPHSKVIYRDEFAT